MRPPGGKRWLLFRRGVARSAVLIEDYLIVRVEIKGDAGAGVRVDHLVARVALRHVEDIHGIVTVAFALISPVEVQE